MYPSFLPRPARKECKKIIYFGKNALFKFFFYKMESWKSILSFECKDYQMKNSPTLSATLGGIEQLRGPTFTQFWPPTTLWTILDILHTTYHFFMWQKWTFYLPLLVHISTEWPLYLVKSQVNENQLHKDHHSIV